MQIVEIGALVPGRGELTLERVVVESGRVCLQVAARRPRVPCPMCGRTSARVHGRYSRTLADLPWHGMAVVLSVEVRRFVCATASCPRRIFCERLARTTAPYARRTTRLLQALELIGLALGGEAGARLASALGMGTAASADTVLRLVHRAPSAGLNATPGVAELPVRVLGVDDWAWRKGQRYGTVLVDLERHRVLDLLPDREPETLTAWLAAHPSVEVISRDRSGAYAEAARQGAPQAMQVADRFHLFRNLTDAVLRHVERHRALLHGLPAAPGMMGRVEAEGAEGRGTDGGEASREIALDTVTPRTRDERAKAAVRERRLALYGRVVELHERGWTAVAIARQVGLVRQTVMRWLRRGGFPERRVGPPRPTLVAPFADYLRRRWAEGCHNQRRLEAEVRVLGYRGGHSAFGDWVRRHLGGRRALRQPSAPVRRLTARRAAWLLTAPDARLAPTDIAWRTAVLSSVPALAELHRHARAFRRIFEEHTVRGLARWLRDAAHGPLATFARGLRRDLAAVRAAITEPWSQGQVEGHVHRLKLIKRTMYGRAGFALLRQRVLALQ